MEPALAALGVLLIGGVLALAWSRRRRQQLLAPIQARAFEVETGEGLALLGRKLGPYRLEQLLGKGGWGTVYRGVHQRTGAPVAIKVIHSGIVQDYADLQRLKREIRTWEQLRHLRLVEFKKYGEEFDEELRRQTGEGLIRYLVMELVEGQPLRRLMRPEGLPPAEVWPLLEPLLEALMALHASGILHRDLKPENIMLSRTGGLKLMDFGLAKSARPEDQLTRQDEVFGTPTYMAPEQLLRLKMRVEAWDARVDQYSVGVIAYELLTGRLPIETTSLTVLLHERESLVIPPPSHWKRKLPPELDAAVMRMLALAPEDRYPILRDAAEALREAFLAATASPGPAASAPGRPAEPPPPPPPESA